MLDFWTDANLVLISENFVAAAVPTWVCRADSPEGEFLRAAGVEKQWVTSSGYMTCLSASGKPLGHAPSAEVLEKFRALPDAERAAGAVRVADLAEEDRLIPAPPLGGMVLRVHARYLTREQDELRYARVEDFPLMGDTPDERRTWRLFLEPNTEYLWMTAAEWKSLIPADAAQGDKRDIEPWLAERLARFHLTPRRAMTSEGGILRKEDIQAARLSAVVEEVTPRRIRLRLAGFIHTGTTFDEAKATTPNGPLEFGFQTPLHGLIEYDRERQTITRFDLIAPGEVWGRWGDANNNSLFIERPGSTPFGFALELADAGTPTERIPPGGNPAYIDDRSGYFSAPLPRRS